MRKFIQGCGVALAMSLFAVNAQAQTPDAQTALCSQGNGDASIAACSAIIAAGQVKGAELSAIYYGRGMAHEALKQYGLAVLDYNEAVTLKSDSREAAFNESVACNYFDRLFLPGGTQAADTPAPENAQAFHLCGNSYSRKEQNDVALRNYDQSISLDPQNAIAYLDRANTKNRLGQTDHALDDYNKSVELKPTPSALINRGTIYGERRQYPQAMADYDAGLKLQPGALPGLNDRCFTRAVMGQELDKALADCTEALRLSPNFVNAMTSRGFVYFRMGNFAAAIADFDATLKINPNSAAAYYMRGLTKIKTGDRSGSDRDISRARELDRKIAEWYAGYGVKP